MSFFAHVGVGRLRDGAAARIGWKDQNARCSAVIGYGSARRPAPSGAPPAACGGPRRTHRDPLGERGDLRRRSASAPLRGIFETPSSRRTACISRLFVGIAGDDRRTRVAAFEQRSRESSRSPPFSSAV